MCVETHFECVETLFIGFWAAGVDHGTWEDSNSIFKGDMLGCVSRRTTAKAFAKDNVIDQKIFCCVISAQHST